ncbi:hypothetical protein SLEP1_g19763 [Rubroshorea leprosula]|uniref:Protein-S-isoprenylcysteine O-methyltransferase n=1 Tax=Rubroshorea leprosula TaxID=152421 RepID=A0AAV5JB11_9ROSI|nr:hypothetical protein SLEP1_g19763 [Rubroshorea leprosula]
METAAVFLHSNTIPVHSPVIGNRKFSLRHFSKHLQGNVARNSFQSLQSLKPIRNPSGFSFPLRHSELLLRKRRICLLPPSKCSYSDTTSSDSENPFLKALKNLSFDSMKTALSQLTPVSVLKWSVMLSVAIAATKWALGLVFNPFFLMYFSWTWLFWPWVVALLLAVYGMYCFWKHSLGEANVFEQLSIVTSVFTWLTLVPPACFNGYLEGWPFVFFFVYHYFFFFNVSVRRRLYGDYYPRPHDPKWDVNLPKWCRMLFCAGVMVAHWVAAFEAPELHNIPGGWSNVGIWILILVTLLMQYNSTLYLAKYSEKIVVPTAVVQFGPYRLVRHPLYASTMLLFVTYFLALRAPLSLLFVVAVCLMYYEQKAKLEEAVMVEAFGDSYLQYAVRVKYKFIPFLY